MRAGSFLSELKRRRVLRVAGAYIVLGWVGVEIVLETFPLLGFPDWVPMAAVILAYVGFPVTLVLAWMFDITGAGVVLTPALSPEARETSAPGTGRVVVPRRPAWIAGVFLAGMIVALVGFGAYAHYAPHSMIRPESIQALAVLPFTDLSADGSQRYFADGVAEDLIHRLARIGEIRVAGRTSSFALRGAGATLEEIGRRLNVDAVVEGSVRRDGNRLRVTVELVDVATGFQIWSDSYDRTVDDIFAIQDDLSAAMVEALRLQLAPEASRLRAGTANVQAHDAYLLGMARWHGRTDADLRRALAYFEEATAQDDAYALAHAGLALTYAVLPYYTDFPAERAVEDGYAAAARALALDAQLAEAHAAIGQIAQGLEWDLGAAEVAYRRAIEFQPSYATAHQWYAETLLLMGRLAAARAEIERAVSLDPMSVSARYVRAYLYAVERSYTAARQEFARLVADHPGYRFGQAGLVLFCLAAGCHDDAIAAAAAAYPAATAELVVQAVRAAADPSLRPAALAALRSADGALPAADLALLLAALGDREGAIAVVARGHEQGGDPTLLLFLVHPLLDGIRGDPRFQRVAESVGVEAPAARLAGRDRSGMTGAGPLYAAVAGTSTGR